MNKLIVGENKYRTLILLRLFKLNFDINQKFLDKKNRLYFFLLFLKNRLKKGNLHCISYFKNKKH